MQAAELAAQLLKRSQPVARKVIGTATSENGAQAISDYLGANGKGLMLNVTDPASIESVLEKFAQNLVKWISRSIMPVSLVITC